jgi:hypothetical protein
LGHDAQLEDQIGAAALVSYLSKSDKDPHL